MRLIVLVGFIVILSGMILVRHVWATGPAGVQIRAGEFHKIYDPSIGESQSWYINDHCFIRDAKGLWHLFGITHAEPAAPADEKFFAHATSSDLTSGVWEKQDPILQADPDSNEVHVWAPHIIKSNDTYYMFYCAGDLDHSRYKIHLATSQDLWTWIRHPDNPMVVDGYDARDPMIFRNGEQWIMYYTATSEPTGGYFVVKAVISDDLIHWRESREVFRHPAQGTAGGPTESPFVVSQNGKYYLFVCTNNPYNSTAVYESESPFAWRIEDMVNQFPAHAAEVVLMDEAPAWLSRAGWGEGGVYLAPLGWSHSTEFTDVTP